MGQVGLMNWTYRPDPLRASHLLPRKVWLIFRGSVGLILNFLLTRQSTRIWKFNFFIFPGY